MPIEKKEENSIDKIMWFRIPPLCWSVEMPLHSQNMEKLDCIYPVPSLGTGLEESTNTQIRGYENTVYDVGGLSWGSLTHGCPVATGNHTEELGAEGWGSTGLQ